VDDSLEIPTWTHAPTKTNLKMRASAQNSVCATKVEDPHITSGTCEPPLSVHYTLSQLAETRLG